MRAPDGTRLPTTVLVALLVLASAPAFAQVKWAKRLGKCEPPSIFYSARHVAGAKPCCPTVPGACAGGVACAPDGRCPGTDVACDPAPPPNRPNVIMVLSDDQGSCHYGTAPECRSIGKGTPLPPPVTPNLDLLAGHGTTFTIAHNTAGWCFPSINSLLTARYQRSFNGSHRIANDFPTIAKAMRSLGGASGAPVDPYQVGSVIGGYCTMLGGKFSASVGDHGFDAVAKSRKLGRTSCVPDPSGGAPLCGSEIQAAYDPVTVTNQRDLFQFLETMLYRVPGTAPAEFRVQPFFVWYAPRIPHAPLTAPPAIAAHLFGSATTAPPGLGGVMNLGRFCGPGGCAPTVTAFSEGKGGNNAAFYASMWWIDDALREIRKWLAMAGTPHCVSATGTGYYRAANAAECPGLWAVSVTPDPARNTVLVYLTDNGWYLPDSKHHFTENGYRTRILVFDPRQLPEVPHWHAPGQPVPPPRETEALAHAVDVLPTVLGLALDTPGTQACPTGIDGQPCDGHDLRPHLLDGTGVPSAPPETLRRALCGHETNRGDAPTIDRYLLTRPGTVGRCTDLDAPACGADADCGPGATCLGGHCIDTAEPACSSSAQCGRAGICLKGRCYKGPACIDDAGCAQTFPAANTACVEPGTRWCRNAPGARCGTHADCPACPAGAGTDPAPCARICEARQLKLYVTPATVPGAVPRPDVTDLFIDPDESGRERGTSDTLTYAMSRPDGPYADTMAKLSCCLDAWWPEAAQEAGTICAGGCPAQFTCNE